MEESICSVSSAHSRNTVAAPSIRTLPKAGIEPVMARVSHGVSIPASVTAKDARTTSVKSRICRQSFMYRARSAIPIFRNGNGL